MMRAFARISLVVLIATPLPASAAETIAYVYDALGRTTSYQYDSSGRRTRVTRPEGNYTQYTYDARGNMTEARQVAKPGSGPADIVTAVSFDASCANAVKCNKPNSTTDARGNVVDYTYDATHGGPLTVTQPAPTGGAARPRPVTAMLKSVASRGSSSTS